MGSIATNLQSLIIDFEMNRIDQTFSKLKQASSAALMPYLPLGYPTLDISHELIRATASAGADVIELGVPFSDPLADGPIIQRATQIALENGMTLAKCLALVRAARADGVDIPLVLMGYYNPILRYGIERFVQDASAAGADGVIVPDLPIEEADELRRAAAAYDFATTFLAAPTSTDERLRKIGDATRGFLYLVSLTGVTGMRTSLAEGLAEFVQRTRRATDTPLCVGFGISNAENARVVAALADGVIVGTALVARIADTNSAVQNARQFVGELSAAVKH